MIVDREGLMGHREKPQKLDQIDVHILKILQEDGRITNTKLAKKVGLSAPPMLERVKKLDKNGFIKSFRAIVDANKIGCSFMVFVALEMDVPQLNRVEAFEERINEMGEVLECHHIAGDIDFLLKVAVPDQESFKDFVTKRLSAIEGIQSIRSWVVLSTNKETTTFSLAHLEERPLQNASQ